MLVRTTVEHGRKNAVSRRPGGQDRAAATRIGRRMAANARRRARSDSEQNQELVGEVIEDNTPKVAPQQVRRKRRRRNGRQVLASMSLGEAWAVAQGVAGWLRSL